MMDEFTGKTAFITGGASGIGLGIAKNFAREGMNVVIGDVQDESLERAEVELKAISNNIFPVNVDVCDRPAMQEVAVEKSSSCVPQAEWSSQQPSAGPSNFTVANFGCGISIFLLTAKVR